MISARITDGTTTVNLNDGSPFEILELELGYGDPSERETSGSIRLLVSAQDVKLGSSIVDIRDNLQALQKLLQQGINYWQYDKGAQIKDADFDIVYLEVQFESGADYYRSPIVKARYSMPNESTWNMSIGGTYDTMGVRHITIEYIIDFARKNWWEGPEVQLELATNIDVTPTLNAVYVYNPKPYLICDTNISFQIKEGDNKIIDADATPRLARFTAESGDKVYVRGSTLNDGDYDILTSADALLTLSQAVSDETASASVYLMGSEACNYVEIAAGDVEGDLPAPIYLEFQNLYATALDELWVGHFFVQPAEDEPIVLEAEDGFYDYVDDLVDPTAPPASEGYYIEFSEPFPVSQELTPIYWGLDTNWLANDYKGRYFKAILKLYDDNGSPDDYNYQLRMRRLVSGDIIWEGPIVRYGYDTDLLARDLGTFRIPPNWRIGTVSPGTLYLELVLTPFDSTVTSVDGIRIDYLELLPVDGFRYYQMISGLPQNAMIIDNGYSDLLYYKIGVSGHGDLIGRGNPIMLQPGIVQRLYFFQGEDIFRYGAVRINYRQRRLSV